MSKQKRTVKSVKEELKALNKKHAASYGPRKFHTFMPVLMSSHEVASMVHMAWLEGYLQALKDERGLK